jgi:hypothetical protein
VRTWPSAAGSTREVGTVRGTRAGRLGSNAGSWDHPDRPLEGARDARPRRGIERGRLGSSGPAAGGSAGCRTAAWDRTREVGITLPGPRDARWDVRPRRRIACGKLGSAIQLAESKRGNLGSGRVGLHEVRTYKCVCGDLLKFGLWLERGICPLALGLCAFLVSSRRIC